MHSAHCWLQLSIHVMELDEADIPIDELPKHMAAIASLIGVPNMLAILKEYGGTRLCFPLIAKPTHRLAALIGLESFQMLCDRYGGDRIEISSYKRLAHKYLFLRKRDREIAATYGPKTIRQLSLSHGLTMRTVERIIAKENVQRGVPAGNRVGSCASGAASAPLAAAMALMNGTRVP